MIPVHFIYSRCKTRQWHRRNVRSSVTDLGGGLENFFINTIITANGLFYYTNKSLIWINLVVDNNNFC